MTIKVFLHTRDPKESEGNNEFIEFERIPVVGEYVSLQSADTLWYKVVLVVHTPFPCDCDAEVYAVGLDHLEAVKASGYHAVS